MKQKPRILCLGLSATIVIFLLVSCGSSLGSGKSLGFNGRNSLPANTSVGTVHKLPGTCITGWAIYPDGNPNSEAYSLNLGLKSSPKDQQELPILFAKNQKCQPETNSAVATAQSIIGSAGLSVWLISSNGSRLSPP